MCLSSGDGVDGGGTVELNIKLMLGYQLFLETWHCSWWAEKRGQLKLGSELAVGGLYSPQSHKQDKVGKDRHPVSLPCLYPAGDCRVSAVSLP